MHRTVRYDVNAKAMHALAIMRLCESQLRGLNTKKVSAQVSKFIVNILRKHVKIPFIVQSTGGSLQFPLA